MGPKYYLQDDEFVIEDYNRAKPFSSFLPGIAGLHGRPLWAFYVNRGQCIASFGQMCRDHAIMEFYPANAGYRRTPLEGFRTFVKTAAGVYEPFRIYGPDDGEAPVQKMFISPHELRIEETATEAGLRFEAVYFTVPNEDFPALARILTVGNASASNAAVELVDGMPKICPYGLNEFFMKEMSRTIEAWMEADCLEGGAPFFRLRVDAADTAVTKYITSGNFYSSALARGRAGGTVIVDPAAVFGDFQDFSRPGAFASRGIHAAGQRDRNITPCAMSHYRIGLAPGASESVLSLIGYASSAAELRKIRRKADAAYFEDKRAENRDETAALASSVSVFSGVPAFDLYIRQTNLDNILRGGYPVQLKGSKKLIYVFNRKHGDLERDYNNFVLNPEPYSQGNGNYRDANQNRRLSVWLNPAVARKDIKDFYDLVQLDGYNPLVVKGDRFSVKDRSAAKKLVRRYFGAKEGAAALAFLTGSFTLGALIKFAGDNSVNASGPFLGDVIESASCWIDAEHGEGFWIDHWTYNLDLVESYLALFPEERHSLLFRDRDYAFFDNARAVKPRSRRIVPGPDGKARQYHGVYFDEEKARMIGSRKSDREWARTRHGRGDVYRCTLAVKMLVIVANKIATLDPCGIGVEMEADKPAWCDSLNGLPALIGSSLSETLELARLANFLKTSFAEAAGAALPAELASFVRGLSKALSRDAKGAKSADRNRNFRYWDASNALKERYRSATRLGVGGSERALDREEIAGFLSLCLRKLEDGIKRGCDGAGVPYTYFVNEMKCPAPGRASGPAVSKPLPLFLEAPVHAMKLTAGIFDAKSLYAAVRKSDLYDKALGMYKLNAPLDGQPLEIGRSRVFTPGWLENESVWLHMEYKFLLEALKNGLYGDFFRDFRSALVPFQDPKRYGRSTLENSSFIASSRFFDEGLRGCGFVARLSGATAEMLSMLTVMHMGRRPFAFEDGELVFSPAPALEASFFTAAERDIRFTFRSGARRVGLKAGSYAFSMFERTLVIYENPKGKDTFGPGGVKPVRFTVCYTDGRENRVDSAVLGQPYTKDLRSGRIESITILLD